MERVPLKFWYPGFKSKRVLVGDDEKMDHQDSFFTNRTGLPHRFFFLIVFKNNASTYHEVNCADGNMTDFANIIDPDTSIQLRVDYLTYDEDIVILGANATHEIQVFNSPRN